MNKAFLALSSCILAANLAACYGNVSTATMPTPVRGGIFMETNATNTGRHSGSFAGNNVGSGKMGNKVGEAECKSYIALIATGDCSVATAAKNGGIQSIGTVEHRAFNVLGVYTVYTTRVIGQ